jgi:RNA polymerase sigma factor (sigma-70 family)
MADTDARSIADLFASYGREMARRARMILRSEEDAEDAVQEVMVGLLEAPHLLTAVDHVAGWLYTLVRRRAIDRVRSEVRRKAREEEVGVAELFAGTPDPEAFMESEDAARVVAAAVEELPETLRAAFVANGLQGITFRELSEQTGVPMGTLMARKKKAVDSIRARLRAEGILPAGPDRRGDEENRR